MEEPPDAAPHASYPYGVPKKGRTVDVSRINGGYPNPGAIKCLIPTCSNSTRESLSSNRMRVDSVQNDTFTSLYQNSGEFVNIPSRSNHQGPVLVRLHGIEEHPNLQHLFLMMIHRSVVISYIALKIIYSKQQFATLFNIGLIK